MHYIIYDLEATCWKDGLDGRTQEVIEIGALKYDESGTLDSRFESFIRPVVHTQLSSFCTQLTGITQIDVNQAEEFPIVIDEFIEWTGWDDGQEYLLCSWGNFDKKIFQKNCRLHDIETDWVEAHISLKHQYQDLHGLRQRIGLKRAIEREGFVFEGAQHRAIYDAENLAKIFVKYLNLWHH